MGDLTDLFEQLKSEIEKQLGREVYSHRIGKGTGWALSAKENGRGNFGNVWTKIKADKSFRNCPLPHLQVAIDNEWARSVGITPEKIKKGAWHTKDHDAAFWCVSKSDEMKLKEMARYLAKVYIYLLSKW